MDEQEIRELIQLKTENKNLDYKEKFNWNTSSNDEKAKLVKDILAMANTQDGGRIIFGVKDDSYDFIGIEKDDFESFDQTKVNDFLQEYTDPKFSCQVYKIITDEKYVVAIDIPEFLEIPIICKRAAHTSDNKQILRKGQIYIRTEKATSEAISSSEEMRELLGRAIVKKGDELLHNIERLIKGKPLKVTNESKEKYENEIREANKFFIQKIGNGLKKYGSWGVCIYPVSYQENLLQDQMQIKNLIDKAEVNLRGWNFPHTDMHGNASNFIKGRQSFTIWDRYVEAYRVYQSGLFIWKRAFWEDIKDYNSDGKPVLSFISAIWSVTEFFLFFKRYYESISLESDLHFRISLEGTKDRKLVSSYPGVDLWKDYISNEYYIPIEEDIKVVDLKAYYKEIANRIISKIFLVFNWDDVSEKAIDDWQRKLIEKRI